LTQLEDGSYQTATSEAEDNPTNTQSITEEQTQNQEENDLQQNPNLLHSTEEE
jgi:hypothetical protein